jgi:molybdopterin molybdotransferase
MSTDMAPVEAHLARVLAAIHPLSPARQGLEEAQGGVLAQDAAARCPLPSFDNSAMDGYAVRAADVAQAGPDSPVTLPVTGEIPAGDTRALTVAPGTCLRIMTGALLPGGADAVVPVEWTDGDTRQVRVSQPAPAGHAVRRRGDDVAEGEVATGNELTEPGAPLTPGRIWDSNSYMLAAAVRQAGGAAERHRVSDDPQAVLSAIEKLSGSADLLITSGGVSMGGEHDVVKVALAGHPGVWFGKVAMQPGMPQGFGLIGQGPAPIFTLPGNPVSAFVSFHLFVRPALDALQGLPAVPLPTVRVVLTAPVSAPPGRRAFLRGVLDAAAGTVTPLSGQGSHQLGALARANVLIVVPEEVVRMAEGDPADVMSLP